jgi:uncharacterized protein YjiS (DUF1127 family)
MNTLVQTQSLFAKVYNFVERFLTYSSKMSKIRSTIRELNSLTDRELSDIGISRADIYEIADQTAKMSA